MKALDGTRLNLVLRRALIPLLALLSPKLRVLVIYAFAGRQVSRKKKKKKRKEKVTLSCSVFVACAHKSVTGGSITDATLIRVFPTRGEPKISFHARWGGAREKRMAAQAQRENKVGRA
jgi:hypothetical protein